ncbi:hypothetical protein D3C79_848700 [compost metagenome]
MSTARAPVGTSDWVLMTGILSSCGALFQICDGRLASLRETDFMVDTSLFCVAFSRARDKPGRPVRAGG